MVWASRRPPPWVPLLHAHYRRFFARMDPLTPARAALRLPVEHEHRPSLPRAGLPRSRHPSLVTIPSPSTTWPTSLLWHATPQPNVRTGVPVSDFAFTRQARRSTKPIRVRHLRTGSPPLIALHPASHEGGNLRVRRPQVDPDDDVVHITAIHVIALAGAQETFT